MWIELTDELIEYTKNIDDPLNKSIISINTLFDSMLKRQHIIYGSYELLQHLEEHKLINQANIKYISWIKQKYIYVYECYETITCKVIVSTESIDIERKGNYFVVPLNCFYETREVKLLTENESDAELFKNIFNQMYTMKKMSLNYSIRLENDSFHGGNAHSKLKKAAENGQMLVCVVDSDKDYKGDGSKSTYKGANEIYKAIQKDHIIHLKKLGVREKENLIPPNMYLSVLNKSNVLLEIMQEFIDDENVIKYFDIKDGVMYKKINDKKWVQNYQKVIDACNERKIYFEPSVEEKDKEKFVCIRGIGASLCDVVNDILLDCDTKCDKNMKHHSIKKEKRESIYDCRKTIFEYLPEYLLDEWNQIYELLFTWGCCLSESFSPNYNFE